MQDNPRMYAAPSLRAQDLSITSDPIFLYKTPSDRLAVTLTGNSAGEL